MKHYLIYSISVFTLLSLFSIPSVQAQTTLKADLIKYTVPFKDNDLVQEFKLPSNLQAGRIYLEATGADGGRKRNGSLNSANGGQGAIMGAWFEIGDDPGKIPPGAEILFIIGQRGGSINNAWAEGAAGGGGTGILFKRSDNKWQLLVVAGGGAGGYADCCAVSKNGEPGVTFRCSLAAHFNNRDEDSYCRPTLQDNYLSIACYAGGGATFDATDMIIYGQDNVGNPTQKNCAGAGTGKKGWPGANSSFVSSTKPTGGTGGAGQEGTSARGGFGFGGGAGSVGFGDGRGCGGGFTPGYSLYHNGGGSFITEHIDIDGDLTEIRRGSTSSPQNGQVKYQIYPSRPVAVCNDLTAYLEGNGSVTVDASSLATGSYDLNGYSLNYKVKERNSFNWQPSVTLNCSNKGTPFNATVQLISRTNGRNVSTTSCLSTITVLSRPAMSCKDATVNLNASGQATLSASSINDGSNVPCGGSISSFSVSPNSFTCADIGTSAATLTATDNNGVSNTCTANVTIVDANPIRMLCKESINIDLGEDLEYTLTPSDIDNGSGDVCGSYSLSNYPQGYSLSKTTLDCENLNTTQTVTLTLNTSNGPHTCSSLVNVILDKSEYAQCRDITVSLNASGEVSLRPYQFQNIDNGTRKEVCGSRVYNELSKTLFTCADIGPNQVTLTLTDLDDNYIDECTATVTVVDGAGPVAKCKPLTVQIPFDGLKTATVWPDDVDDGFNDVCANINRKWLWDPGLQPAEDVEHTLTIKFDYYAFETSWSVTSGEKVFAETDVGFYSDYNDQTLTTTFSLSPGRYDFNIYDLFGDGMGYESSYSSMGYYKLEDENGRVIFEGNGRDYDYQKTINFYVDGGFFTDRVYYRCKDIGTTRELRVYQRDEYGNGSYCTSTVTVEQDLSENAKCKDLFVTLDQSGQNGFKGQDFNDGSITSTCQYGYLTREVFPDKDEYNYTCADVGENIINLYLKNNDGEVIDECFSRVMVRDEAGPNTKCKPVTVELDGSGLATLNASALDDGSFDVCGTVSDMRVWDPGKNSFSEEQFTLTIEFDAFAYDNSWTIKCLDKNKLSKKVH